MASLAQPKTAPFPISLLLRNKTNGELGHDKHSVKISILIYGAKSKTTIHLFYGNIIGAFFSLFEGPNVLTSTHY